MKSREEVIQRINEMLAKNVLLDKNDFSRTYSTGYYNALRWVVDEDEGDKCDRN